MKLYPLMANLEYCNVLVVGGGEVATRKVRVLIGTGAHIQVVSPDFTPEVESLISKGKIVGFRRAFSYDDLPESSLVFAATDDPNLNDNISQKAREMGIPVNNVTNPEGCTFFVPSQLVRGDLTLSISSAGKSPATTKWIRRNLEKLIGPEYETLVEWMGTLRKQLSDKAYTTSQIREISEYLLDHDILVKLKTNDKKGVLSILEAAFQSILNTHIPEPVITTLGLN